MKLGALLAVGVSLLSLNVFAADGDYMKFLTSMEGTWQGQGSAYDHATGRQTNFQFEMSDQREGSQTAWMANIYKSTSSGATERDTATFAITGNFLSISHDSVFGSGSVTYSTDHSIEYTIMTINAGSFLDFNFRWDVQAGGLTGKMEVQQDGITVYEENWQARKGDSLK